MNDYHDSQLIAWATAYPKIRKLWRFDKSERPKDWPDDRITVAVKIDRTRRTDDNPSVSWCFDKDDFELSLLNATTCDFRIYLHDKDYPEIVRDIAATGVLLYAREDEDNPSLSTPES